MPDELADSTGLATTSTAAHAVATVADLLTEAGFNLDIPGDSCLLKISNVRGALCELTVSTVGAITWEYRSHAGRHADPAQLASLVLHLLDLHATDDSLPTLRRDDLTLKGFVGRTLADHGMHVTLHVLDIDDYYFDIYAEVQITSPGSPERGTVRLSDDGAVWWDCQTVDADIVTVGLTLPEIAGTISQALTRAGHLRSHA